MKIAVISDLHLGNRGAADLFGHEDSEFLNFLGFLERNFEKIVLLGDVWETLTGHIPDAARELRRARDSHPEIARRFLSPQYVYVHGNHDWIAGRVERRPEEVAIESDGVHLLFTHGHQNDGLIEHARWLSEAGVWIGAWLRRSGLGAVYAALRRLDELRQGTERRFTPHGFQRWAIRFAELKRADVVVTGHTHLATRAEHGAKLFLNSGSCSEGKFTFLSIDTHAGVYGVHHTW